MEVISLLIPMALSLGALFLLLFVWATKSGQYDDLDTPANRMLLDEENNINQENTQGKSHVSLRND